MIFAHLPAGYIVSTMAWSRMKLPERLRNRFIGIGMAGAVAPDLDLLYFYLVDHRHHHHHSYWTHFPSLWLCLLVISAVWLLRGRSSRLGGFLLVFSLNGFWHMFLDGVVGDIWWFAPFVDRAYSLFPVAALYHPWWLNFILHWSVALELTIVTWAMLIWRRRGSRGGSRSHGHSQDLASGT